MQRETAKGAMWANVIAVLAVTVTVVVLYLPLFGG
jgi:hypothetical protein